MARVIDGVGDDDHPSASPLPRAHRDEETDWYIWIPTEPHLIHSESCPTAFPLVRITGKGWERYECHDCDWAHDSRN